MVDVRSLAPWRLGLSLLLVAACRRTPSPRPPRPVQADLIARQSTLVWHATVTRARSLPVAVGSRCRFEARVGYDPSNGALDLLFHGDCGATKVYLPMDEDLGTGAMLESGQRGCTLTALATDGGPIAYAVSCPRHRGPPTSRSHELSVEGATAHLQQRWGDPWALDLAWEPAGELAAPSAR